MALDSCIPQVKGVLTVKDRVNLLREFSVPLLAGVVLALCWANYAPERYALFLHNPFL